MCWICEQQKWGNLNQSITLGHIYLEIRVLSSKIGWCNKKPPGHNFWAKKKSPHGGLRMAIPQASMRGFFFLSKIVAGRLFITPKSAQSGSIRQGKSSVQKEGKFWNWSGRPDFLHPMVYICMVDVNTIITFGFYQWKRVLASSTIMGLKCKLYLKVRLKELRPQV